MCPNDSPSILRVRFGPRTQPTVATPGTSRKKRMLHWFNDIKVLGQQFFPLQGIQASKYPSIKSYKNKHVIINYTHYPLLIILRELPRRRPLGQSRFAGPSILASLEGNDPKGHALITILHLRHCPLLIIPHSLFLITTLQSYQSPLVPCRLA